MIEVLQVLATPQGLHGCSPEVLPCPSAEGHFHMQRPAVRLRVGMKTGKFGSLRDPVAVAGETPAASFQLATDTHEGEESPQE